MNIDINVNANVDVTAYRHENMWTTHPCLPHEWYGDEICSEVTMLSDIKLPDGCYKIKINIQKID